MRNLKRVFVNGCFDVLHRGHIELLRYAESLGEYVIVGLDSDSRIREMKGAGRPINSQEDRKAIMESLEYVNEVYFFDSDEELEILIEKVRAGTMIVGEEYKDKKVIGHRPEISLHFFPKIDGYSTTRTVENFTDR